MDVDTDPDRDHREAQTTPATGGTPDAGVPESVAHNAEQERINYWRWDGTTLKSLRPEQAGQFGSDDECRGTLSANRLGHHRLSPLQWIQSITRGLWPHAGHHRHGQAS